MSDVTITIDGQNVQAREGEILLFRALAEGFFIPHLCAIEGVMPPPSSCRLCYVEIEGRNKPVTSCTAKGASKTSPRTDGAANEGSAMASAASSGFMASLFCPAQNAQLHCALKLRAETAA